MLRLFVGLLMVIGGGCTLVEFDPTTISAFLWMILGFLLMGWELTDEKVLNRLDDIRCGK